MKKQAYVDLGFACVDTDRQKRRGFPEVIFCQKKTKEDIVKIARELARDPGAPLLLTHLDPRFFGFLKARIKDLRYDKKARAAYRRGRRAGRQATGEVLIVTAGTSDIPVAEEAALTLELMGVGVRRLYDVGVAGVHRIMDKKDLLRKASVVIVVAGMEGALASLVSGLVRCPVVAVPTSCGYGSSFEGLAALLTMLNSCSPGIAVMNIDNGFGAGYFAGLVSRR
ncbi:MAG: nickel pincer cofactor biosynthesis protein LarB [Candidatus Omnitrophica bacterium]|nr:nickel pincer cofactor biosynthesis protein LarB [Candidatus Omnitrophota bacterium]MDD5573960.1 nickel pincer cofactor biosynthesis protein LarB [Candidatus Omnitrophota bacterium]